MREQLRKVRLLSVEIDSLPFPSAEQQRTTAEKINANHDLGVTPNPQEPFNQTDN